MRRSKVRPDAAANLGMAAADLVENGDRPQAWGALQQRHHLAVPNSSQRISPPATTWCFPLRREPGILFDAIGSGGTEPGLDRGTLAVSVWRKLMNSLIWQSVMWRPGKVRFLIDVKNPLPIRSTTTASQRAPYRAAPFAGFATSVGLRPPSVTIRHHILILIAAPFAS